MTLAGEILILMGVTLIVVASIGLHRFDDVFARIHASGKATALGFLLVAIGALFERLAPRTATELALASLLLLITTPVGVHLLARAAYRSGDLLSPETVIDELAEARAREADEAAGRPDDPPTR